MGWHIQSPGGGGVDGEPKTKKQEKTLNQEFYIQHNYPSKMKDR